ncbi:MAG: ABC-F family ATP-binding cassette domain-containing protein, partial [Bacteriovoracaceae bacterium]|nr:ABC-F family ATP-binding cassette domain-containing protein [Bacteriovoracaceae bacterium]
QADLPLETFSGGRKMRIALAAILALNPDVLLMDEPTNYLDVESIIWLEQWLQNFKGAVLMTCHDRDFMNNIVSRIIALENQQLVSYGGNYDFYEHEREVRRQQLTAAYERQQQKLAKEEEFIARFAARASHAAQVQSRVKKIEKIERITLPPEEKVMRFSFAEPPRSGNDVLKLEHLAKSFGEHQVFHDVSAMVRRLDKIALVGINGAGKSTLLKIINQVIPPTAGTCTLGASVNIGYFGQLSLEILDANHTVLEEAQRFLPNANVGTLRNLLAAFLFQGDDIEKKVSILSGGEKSRLLLATILARPVNFLILDEPTNHLDIKSREILLTELKNFNGTILFVSHDRHFCRQLATRVFEIHQGLMTIYEGDYNYYLSKTKHRVHY